MLRLVRLVVHSHLDPRDEDGHVQSVPVRQRGKKDNAMSRKALSAELQNQLDSADIPEAPPEAWLHARQPGLYRPVKKPVTLRLDADVVAWFKEHTQGRGYQTEINRVLRHYMADAQA
jgi:uncharacterized protein (DUF4415 family)